MPTRVNREKFLHTLESVQPGLSPREIIEQSSCFVFKGGEVFSYNDEVACRCNTDLPEEVEGSVQADPLLNILRKLPEDEIEIEVGETEFLVKGKKRQAGIRMEKEILLPVGSVERPKKWSPLHEHFAEAVGIVQQCAGKDESQFSLTCVHIHPEWVEACDNFQLCRWEMATGLKKSTLVRQSAIKHITSLGVTEFSETSNWLHFRTGSLVFSCRRYVEDFPDLAGILEVGEAIKTSLPKGLADAADKAAVFSAENTDNNQIFLSLSQGRLKVRGEGVSGWYWETKRMNYDGPPLEFYISPELLIDLLKRHTDCLLSTERLKVDTGSYTYVSCLGAVRDKEQESEELPAKKRKKVKATQEEESE